MVFHSYDARITRPFEAFFFKFKQFELCSAKVVLALALLDQASTFCLSIRIFPLITLTVRFEPGFWEEKKSFDGFFFYWRLEPRKEAEIFFKIN